jgi:hypothetical protein
MRRRSKPLQPGLLLAHIVDEFDPRVGSEFVQENAIDGVVGVEDYSIARLCVTDAGGHRFVPAATTMPSVS